MSSQYIFKLNLNNIENKHEKPNNDIKNIVINNYNKIIKIRAHSSLPKLKLLKFSGSKHCSSCR